MKYAILDIIWCESHGIEVLPEWRKNNDGTKVVKHITDVSLYDTSDIPVYEHDDPEFIELLNSEEWTTELSDVDKVVSRSKAVTTYSLLISEEANKIEIPEEAALDNMDIFPIWGDPDGPAAYGKQVDLNFKCRVLDGNSKVLYKCVKSHVIQADWKPGISTMSLWLPVSESPDQGTFDNPIPWQVGMEMIIGKYYIENEIKYYGVRSSDGVGLAYDLATLASQGWAEVVTEPKPEPGGSGTLEDPFVYLKNQTSLEKGKYYIENGIIYLCIQSSGPIIYNLSEVPSLVTPVEEQKGSGTYEDPYIYIQGRTALEVGSYYKEGEVLYKCNVSTGAIDKPLSKLSDYVSVVEEIVEPDGSLENPFPYIKNQTSIVKDYYYIENDIVYLCIQPSGPMPYDLSQVPALATPVKEEPDTEEPSGELGTKENPIPYKPNETSLVKDKYYTEFDVVYLCTLDAGVQIYNLSQMPFMTVVS